jgi:hypothetical protein
MKKVKVVLKSGEETEREQSGVFMQRGYRRFETFSDIKKRRGRVNRLLKKYA